MTGLMRWSGRCANSGGMRTCHNRGCGRSEGGTRPETRKLRRKIPYPGMVSRVATGAAHAKLKFWQGNCNFLPCGKLLFPDGVREKTRKLEDPACRSES